LTWKKERGVYMRYENLTKSIEIYPDEHLIFWVFCRKEICDISDSYIIERAAGKGEPTAKP
jgi:hypothetical protein